MIYATEARAHEVAAELNARIGYGESHAVLTRHGWTVICKWVW
jgi:hypothetical protein